MGAGSSQEATFDLVADVPAGCWHLAADAIILAPVDVTVELLWRRPGRDDVVLLRDQHHFEPPASGSTAQTYDVTQDAAAITWQEGDQLVFRYTGTGSTLSSAYVPNGEGDTAGGRIPFIDLPGG